MNIIETITKVLPAFALVGTYLLIMAHDRKNLPERVKKNGIETEGIITEISQNNTDSETLVVDFSYPNGSYRHVSNQNTNLTSYKVGQKVKVWYYFYKSKREVIMEGEGVGDSPSKLYRWGIIICLISYPFMIIKLLNLV